MKTIHHQEREQLEKLFQQENIDQFESRYTILEAFLRTESHITIGELVGILNDAGYSFSPDFVRDTLKLMCRFGFAQKNRFDNGQIRYEHRHLGQHHDHMVCTKCRKIIEFADDMLERCQAQVAATHGFLMLQHKMEIYGICFDCMNSRIEVMPLVAAKQGERLVIDGFSGGTTSRIRLMTLGLRIGDAIEVITNLGRGQLVIAAAGKRYVMGRGLAEKVLVKPPERSENSSAAKKA